MVLMGDLYVWNCVIFSKNHDFFFRIAKIN